MRNAEAVLEALSRIPQEGAVLDQEPMPVGRVTRAEQIPGAQLVVHEMTIEIESRTTGETESHDVLVIALECGDRTVPLMRIGADELQGVIEI